VDLARATLAHDPGVTGRDVPDMRGEAVARIERVEPPQRPVADDLGHDRGCCDRGAPLVAVDDGRVLWSAGPEAEAVDEAGLRRRSKGMEGPPQAREVRAVQTLSIDLPGRDRLHRDLRRAAEHGAEELLSLLRADLLRVVQKGERADAMIAEELVVEENSGDDERAGE
jgi:DNA-directed RNA polymerase subunit N (RpoN/RPB10)